MTKFPLFFQTGTLLHSQNLHMLITVRKLHMLAYKGDKYLHKPLDLAHFHQAKLADQLFKK